MKAIAAMASNRVIGKDGKLPWKIKGDLQFFKKMTNGCRCIVGRKTFDTLPHLPNRRFVVMTQNADYLKDKVFKNEVVGVAGDPEHRFLPIYSEEQGETWVIGGALIYKSFLPLCTDLYLTRIFQQCDGDTFFPSFEHLFIQKEVIEMTKEYAIIHYVRRQNES